MGFTVGFRDSKPITLAKLFEALLSQLRNMTGLGVGVWGLGFGVWGLGFGVWGLGFGVWRLGFGVWGLGLGFRVWGSGFRVLVVGTRQADSWGAGGGEVDP